jgi:hypothetical protein
MKLGYRTAVALGLGWLLCYTSLRADETLPTQQPICPPGHRLVEETVQKEVCRHCCKYITDVKKVKKAVYECREEPICLPNCHFGCSLFGYRLSFSGCGWNQRCGHKPYDAECDRCELRMRKVLIKREIVEEVPICRCVVETVKETIPVKVFRQVPCVPPSPCPPKQ